MEASAIQLCAIYDHLVANNQLDPRYESTYYLSSCLWLSAFISDQSLESIQITFAFDLKDPRFSRKRVASSDPVYRPSKGPLQESTYWTDTSNQSLMPRATATTESNPGPSTSTTISSKIPRPNLPGASASNLSFMPELLSSGDPSITGGKNSFASSSKRRNRAVVSTRTPRLTDSGMAEYGVFSNPARSEDYGPELEVIRDLEKEEEEIERQLILDSQTRREVEKSQVNQVQRAHQQLIHDLEMSLDAKDQADEELEAQHQTMLRNSRHVAKSNDYSGKRHIFVKDEFYIEIIIEKVFTELFSEIFGFPSTLAK